MKRGRDGAPTSSTTDPLMKKLRELDADGALDMLGELRRRWRLDEEYRGQTMEEQVQLMFSVMDVNYRSNLADVLDTDRGNFGLQELDDRIRAEEMTAIGLYHRLHELGMLPVDTSSSVAAGGDGDDMQPMLPPELTPEEAAKRDTHKCIVKVLEMVFYAKRVVLGSFQAKLAVHQMHLEDGTLDLSAPLDARLGSWSLRFRYIDAKKIQPFQNLLLFLLDGAMERRYRKSNGWMYEPVYIGGKNTHAWRPVMEISEFVYGMLQKETYWEQWCHATATGLKNISAAIDYLTKSTDYQLPKLRKQRGVYSFRNGVYLARHDAFYAFDREQVLSENVVACKFFDDEFVEYSCPWRSIPTPHLQSIMDYQQFSDEVCDWMYVLLGRLLYALNELDSWQVIPFFKGQASSGKCMAAGTRVLMHDGTTRAVEHVGVGDLLMGDDGTPRRVLELARGVDDMFTLAPCDDDAGYEPLTVTGEHVLCLKRDDGGDEVVEMTVHDYLARPPGSEVLACYRVDGVDEFATTSQRGRELGTRQTRQRMLDGLLGRGALSDDLADEAVFLARSLGYDAVKLGDGHVDVRKGPLRWCFDVVPAGRQEYFGFQTDGNQRFVLADFTVTHNSTIVLKVCKAFYDAQDVGVLSNNIERKFGLSAFHDKYVFLAPELRNDLALEQAEFQSVVSGEDIQVNVKHQKAFSTTWTVPGALAGNEVPAWADASGSVQRRVVLFEFARAVTNGDMKLADKLMTEMPAILAKCNKAYLEMVDKHSHVNIWTVLPDYFKQTRDQLAQSVNSVEAFLASTEIVHGADLYCPMEDFRAALKSFEMRNNYKSKKYDVDFFRGPFSKHGLRIERAKKAYRGTNKTRDYVMGIDINDVQADEGDL